LTTVRTAITITVDATLVAASLFDDGADRRHHHCGRYTGGRLTVRRRCGPSSPSLWTLHWWPPHCSTTVRTLVTITVDATLVAVFDDGADRRHHHCGRNTGGRVVVRRLCIANHASRSTQQLRHSAGLPSSAHATTAQARVLAARTHRRQSASKVISQESALRRLTPTEPA